MEFEMDIERFINQVKNHPELWDVKSDGYKDKNKKRMAWLDICEMFCENYSKRSEAERNSIGHKLISKWKNIRDSYLKSKRRKFKAGQNADCARKYIYAKQLTFLNDMENNRGDPQSSVNTSADATPSTTSDLTPRPTPRRSAKRKRNSEDNFINFLNGPFPIPAVLNEDKHFFDCLVPIVHTFTLDQKLEFRIEVLNLIKRIRTSPSIPTSIPIPSYHESMKSLHSLFRSAVLGTEPTPAHHYLPPNPMDPRYSIQRPMTPDSNFSMSTEDNLDERRGHFNEN